MLGDTYFSCETNISIVIVSHILPDKIDFIEILSNNFKVEFIIPKPNSIDNDTFNILNKKFNIFNITRDEINLNQEKVLNKFKNIKNNIVIIDIGGYFSKILPFLIKKLGNKIIGVVEDTENGHQKYDKIIAKCNIPILSVARSILKEGEDFLVGQSIVFSTDYVLRLNNTLLNNKRAGIIGFGKIGKSIANELKLTNIQLGICDINPYKGIESLTYGYNFLNKNKILKESDILFLSTGNFSLSGNDFEKLKNGAILSSVTSSDDELDILYLEDNYKKEVINNYTTLYYKDGKYIYLLNGGNAINFINKAVVGEFIYLVQAEIIHCIYYLVHNKILNTNKIITIENKNKKYIAKLWLKNFNS